MYPSKNIIENAVNSKDHTTLDAAVKAAGLVETLQGKGPVRHHDVHREGRHDVEGLRRARAEPVVEGSRGLARQSRGCRTSRQRLSEVQQVRPRDLVRSFKFVRRRNTRSNEL